MYLPFSIAGIETIGAEIMEQAKAQAGRQPDVVLVTHAGGGNFTGAARGLRKSGYTGKMVGVSVNLADLDSDVYKRQAVHPRSPGYKGMGIHSLYARWRKTFWQIQHRHGSQDLPD